MTDKKDDTVVDFSQVKNERTRKELRSGSRINVAYKKIQGLLHTEVESKENQWEEDVKLVVLKDVSNSGFQVTTEDTSPVDFIGNVVFSLPTDTSENKPVAIDAKCTWANVLGNKFMIGFQYRAPDDEGVQLLINTAYR